MYNWFSAFIDAFIRCSFAAFVLASIVAMAESARLPGMEDARLALELGFVIAIPVSLLVRPTAAVIPHVSAERTHALMSMLVRMRYCPQHTAHGYTTFALARGGLRRAPVLVVGVTPEAYEIFGAYGELRRLQRQFAKVRRPDRALRSPGRAAI